MNPAVKATAAVGQAGALCQVLLWLIWKIWGIDIPQEVSIPFVIGVSPIIHGILSWIENRTGIDVSANGNGNQEVKP